MSGHVVGVDLGGSNVRALLADATGTPLVERTDTTVDGDAQAVVAQLVGICRRLADDLSLGWDSIAAAAVGVPGVAHGGGIRLAPNLPPFDGVDLAAALRSELGVDVGVDNDANVAALAELRRGLGAGRTDFVFIVIGTGIGMGIVAGGRLQRGASGAAGEIGGLPLGGEPVELEEIASGIGVARRYAERDGARPGTVTSFDVYGLAAAGDEHAVAVIEDQARAVAVAAVTVQSVLDPELVVLGGGIGSRADFLERVRTHLPRLTRRPPALAASVLGERAGAIGAAQLALERRMDR